VQRDERPVCIRRVSRSPTWIVLHFILPTRHFLSTTGAQIDPARPTCGEIAILEHLLWTCKLDIDLWQFAATFPPAIALGILHCRERLTSTCILIINQAFGNQVPWLCQRVPLGSVELA